MDTTPPVDGGGWDDWSDDDDGEQHQQVPVEVDEARVAHFEGQIKVIE
jgi:hypothetical protein